MQQQQRLLFLSLVAAAFWLSFVSTSQAFLLPLSSSSSRNNQLVTTVPEDDNHPSTLCCAVRDGGSWDSLGGDDNNNNDNDDPPPPPLDDDYDSRRRHDAWEHNARRTDVRLFLTQRALQSFMHLLVACRDPHTVQWLENKYQFANLEKYHGTGAFNLTLYGTWDALLLDLLQQPPDVVVVSARRRGRGHGGWSKHNPYLEDRFVEFRVDIAPASLASRLVQVRQQIAHEWVTDLGTLQTVNGQILASYHDRQSQMRQQEEQQGARTTTKQNPKDNEDCEQTTGGQATFERNAGYYLSNKILEESETTGHTSSQLRQGNFDLLTLLATQEALHRVLRNYQQAGDERSVSRQWLQQFYTQRLRQYFDGHGEWHRADDFLQELLSTPPSTVELKDDRASSSTGTMIGLVDPLRIAQDLLEARAIVIDEWQDIMRDVVPKDHMELQKSILAVRMGQTIDGSSTSSSANEAGASSSSGSVFGEGTFE